MAAGGDQGGDGSRSGRWWRMSDGDREWLLIAGLVSIALLWNLGPYAS